MSPSASAVATTNMYVSHDATPRSFELLWCQRRATLRADTARVVDPDLARRWAISSEILARHAGQPRSSDRGIAHGLGCPLWLLMKQWSARLPAARVRRPTRQFGSRSVRYAFVDYSEHAAGHFAPRGTDAQTIREALDAPTIHYRSRDFPDRLIAEKTSRSGPALRIVYVERLDARGLGAYVITVYPISTKRMGKG